MACKLVFRCWRGKTDQTIFQWKRKSDTSHREWKNKNDLSSHKMWLCKRGKMKKKIQKTWSLIVSNIFDFVFFVSIVETLSKRLFFCLPVFLKNDSPVFIENPFILRKKIGIFGATCHQIISNQSIIYLWFSVFLHYTVKLLLFIRHGTRAFTDSQILSKFRLKDIWCHSSKI